MIVNLTEAKKNLDKLVEAAMRGEEVILARRGKPLIRIVPVSSSADEEKLRDAVH
jgi:prevent-host-death family protein